MKTTAFIPVRGGSKSIPQKNIKLIAGKPLIYWTLLAAENCSEIENCVVATDSEEIAEVARSFHFKKTKIYFRQAENATDTASTESVMLEYLTKHPLPLDSFFILLQATNPFTTEKDLSLALEKLKQNKKKSVLSVVSNKRFYWGDDGKPMNYNYENRPRRQDFQGCWMENGAFYINTVGEILKTKQRLADPVGLYEMPEYTGFEIDEPEDWLIVDALLIRQNQNKGLSSRPLLKLFLTDIDGVLTDAGMYYSENGDELKKFNTHDGMGLQLVKKLNIKTGIITSENRVLNQRRAEKLKLDFLFQGAKSKLEIAKQLCKDLNIELENVAYIGDDINCFDLLSEVGYKACPANAVNRIKNIPGIHHLQKKGGDGALREWIEFLFQELNLNPYL
ncbi:MAG: cytidylyltransferase domain-containing protein [Pseudobdellovibrionaceae bacterium]